MTPKTLEHLMMSPRLSRMMLASCWLRSATKRTSTSKQLAGGVLWVTEKNYVNPMFDLQMNMFEGMATELIPLAAMTFPSDTGLGHDNIAPRSLARLSPEALKTLATLFVAFERFGDWAEVHDLVLVVLLPKSDNGIPAGYRPIGLFPTTIRVWFRVRLVTVKI